MNTRSTPDRKDHILVVDDDATTRMLIKESLLAAGFEVTEARDGEEALARYREVDPDLVLMDVVMPKLDGYEVCRRLRELPRGDEVPILMATSLEDVDSINRAYTVGASDFITKPINWALIGHRVRYMVRGGRIQQNLRRSETRNRALADAIPDLMCRLTPDGEFLEIRPSGESAIFGDIEPGGGRRIQDCLPEPVAAPTLDAMHLALESAATQHLEFAMPLNGVTAHFEARFVASGDREVMTIIRDITRRKQMEESLRSSEERFRSLIENTADLITLLNGEGEFTYTSPAVERTLHHPPEDLVGCRFEDLVHDEDVPVLRNCLALARSAQGKPHAANLRVATSEGMWRIMETVFMSMTNVEGGLSIVVNSRDITGRLEAELALHKSEEQLQQSQKMEAIGRLAGGVAHDFNNLLTAILGYSQILDERLQAEGQPSDEIREVRKAGQRASSLTRQLLTFSRKQISQPRVVDLNAITADMEKMLRRLMGEDVELVTRLNPGLHQVMADPGQLEQVVMNLAVNARDAMPTGGKLVIETANVTFDEAYARGDRNVVPGDYVMIAVSDNGSGIPADQLDKIFEPFYTTKERDKGTGLGLSTVYGIVKQSNGHIWTYSEPGQGATFKVYLPVTTETDRGGTTPAGENRKLTGTETILLAEDEAWVRKLVSQCLEKQGYTVLSAEDGEHAVQIHQRYMGTIDLLLTDVVMPKLNGVDLAERISQKRPDCRVLFMSGYTDHAILQHGRLPPDRSFLQKPFTIQDLATRVRDVLDRKDIVVTTLP